MTEKNGWDKYKENLGETRPWDLLNPNAELAPDVLQEQRYSICKSCPEFINLTTQCKKCGCIMKLKTKLSLAQCPINKW
jgi:hypothetical protein